MCESMLKENNYIKESSSIEISTIVTEMATQMFNRIVAMVHEMELLEDEKPVISNDDVDDGLEVQKQCGSNEEEKDLWEGDLTASHQQDFITLEYKKKVVAMAKAHPKWSLATLQKRGASLLKRKDLIKTWEATIAAGGTIFDKYEAINSMTFKRFEEAKNNLEQVTTSTLQQWALNYARELKFEKFVASKRWATRFKHKHGIEQHKITKFLQKADG
ncbi:PREDICTED: uncharacterized protein LOC107191282 [Dufourea novaeangliae]|uniref:uncharacterized protein LOC107191282 n=1 Tax=Dufourea novaeangliae TaxID=178035 RepID=UPI000767C5BE|nr:PREDICTED: uncharacterized protein LOC107191282 [Dufourea novaeangliae]